MTQSTSNPLNFTVVFGGSLSDQKNLNLITGTNGVTFSQVVIQALDNLAQDNMWRGPVTLANSSFIDVAPNTRLSLFGAVDDNTQTLTLPSGSGQFTLSFNGSVHPIRSTSATPRWRWTSPRP